MGRESTRRVLRCLLSHADDTQDETGRVRRRISGVRDATCLPGKRNDAPAEVADEAPHAPKYRVRSLMVLFVSS